MRLVLLTGLRFMTNYIRKVLSQRQRKCSLCSKIIRIKEFCYEIIDLPTETMVSSVNICSNCFFPIDWIEDFIKAIELAEGKEFND